MHVLKWKYCHSDFSQKPLTAIKPLVLLRLKNLAPSHLVLRGKASQMICDHRNFTLGQLEAGCWPAMSWLLIAKVEQLLAGCILCSNGCRLPAAQGTEMNERIRSFLSSTELCPACGRKSNRGSRDLLYPKLGDKVDTEEGPVGDRRMSKLVLLVMRRKGGKMEEKRVWKHNGKGR